MSKPDFQSRAQQGASLFRKGGVYLITGGTGGLGLEVARHLSEEKDARLVLVSRHQQELEGGLADALQVQADVGDRKALENAIKIAEEHFGKIDGVFHCAGTLADAPFVTKSKESLDGVLRPKVIGAAHLVELFAERELDFMVFYSSVSGWLGTVGQIDYAASCLFLDVLAQRADAECSFPVSSIAWGPWKEVGMAARLLEEEERTSQRNEKVNHPVLQEKETQGDTVIFSGKLRAEDTWMLDGHRTQSGISLLPGTAYLELVRSAVSEVDGRPVAISDIVFLSPLVVEGPTEIRLEYEPSSGDFAIRSRALLETGTSEWTEHSSGKAEIVNTEKVPAESIEDLLADCRDSHRTFDPGDPVTRQEEMLRFGKRWSVLEEAWYGTNCSVGKLSLGEEFRDDLEGTPLHPAMLDIATGFALPLIEGYEEADSYYVPVSYQEVKVYGSLEPTIYSFVQCENPSNQDSLVFDIQILDEQGNVLVKILGFRMARIGGPGLELHQDRSPATTQDSDPVDELDLEQMIASGLLNGEGIEALELLLTEEMPVTVMVSPFDPGTWRNRLDHPVKSDQGQEEEQDNDDQSALLQKRPDLPVEYVEPRGEVEKKIATIWKESLGIAEVGRDDNYYQLGGHSLALVQIIIRIRKELKVDIPVGDPDLFDNPTIGGMAKFADEGSGKSPEQKPVPIRRLSRTEFLISRTELN